MLSTTATVSQLALIDQSGQWKGFVTAVFCAQSMQSAWLLLLVVWKGLLSPGCQSRDMALLQVECQPGVRDTDEGLQC